MTFLDMSRPLNCIFNILLIQVFIISSANSQSNTPEKFMLHTDRQIYLTGETIWYKIYNTNFKELGDHSKVAYVNFHGKNGNLLIQQKVQLKEGEAHGFFDIPMAWKEDYYYITCFTKWNLNFENNEPAIKRIAVYNQYESGGKTKHVNVVVHIDDKPGDFIIELQKPGFGRREEAGVRIATADGQKANISISIHSMHGFNSDEFSMMKDQINAINRSVHYRAEGQSSKEQGLQIHGTVTDPESGRPVISDVLSMYKVGGDSFYRIASGDGNVQTSVKDLDGNAIFQLFNMNPYQTASPDFTLKFVGEKLYGLEKEQAFPPRNEKINAYIKTASLSQKIHEIFDDAKYDSLLIRKITPFPFKADKVYQMEKFKSMKTLEEFIREIVIYAEVSEKDDKPTVRLKNSENQRFFMERPWYLVDGYLTRDEEQVLAIPFKNLTRVELYNTNKSILSQLESVMIRSGMIAVYTDNYYLKDQVEAARNIFTYNGFNAAKPFEGIPSATLAVSRENPVFESLLYWNPEVIINEATQLEFVTSDLLGEYIIEVEGITEDGRKLSGSQIFFVSY